MGTRGTVHIFQTDEEYAGREHLVSIYVQYDSYPEGLGEQLAQFIQSGKLVNGIPGGGDGTLYFNGAGCFAAQLIAKLKDGAGGVYVTTADDSQEYNYTILVPQVAWSPGNKNNAKPILIGCVGDYDKDTPKKPIPTDKFLAWCKDRQVPLDDIPDTQPRPIRPVIPIPKE